MKFRSPFSEGFEAAIPARFTAAAASDPKARFKRNEGLILDTIRWSLAAKRRARVQSSLSAVLGPPTCSAGFPGKPRTVDIGTPMDALDLRMRPPRSCYEKLDGLMLMPHTIDKLRGQLPGGNRGGYFINGQIKGISGYLLDRLGIYEAELLDAVSRGGSEEEVARWLRTRTDASQYPAINESLGRIRPKHSQDESYFRSEYAETLQRHPDLEFIVDIVDADDRLRFGLPR